MILISWLFGDAGHLDVEIFDYLVCYFASVRGAKRGEGLDLLECKLAVYEDNGIPHIRFLFEHDGRIDLRLQRILELCDIAISKPELRLLYVMPSNIRRRVADVKAGLDLFHRNQC